MHRHPILYPVVAAQNLPGIKVSDLKVLPYREHVPEANASSSKYVCPCHVPGPIRGDPTGLGSAARGRGMEGRPSPLPDLAALGYR